ncbi:MAG: CDP-alcohol phosphatidyltransferase family protein [Clostridia bacterium]|nr:CDP-alcohol phosphatidyltransferase family protein [Clostridia bacterium]
MLKYVPNILTIIRFLLIPFILYSVIAGNYLVALLLFTISGITDIADGFIARKFQLISNFGKLMDPLADKLTQISMLAILVLNNMIPAWILIIVALKEITMVCGASFLYGKDVVVYSRWYGKLATVLFYLAIVSSLLIEQFAISNWIADIDLYLYYLALLTTLFALVMYIKTIYSKGFINKEELHKDVTVEKKERKKN